MSAQLPAIIASNVPIPLGDRHLVPVLIANGSGKNLGQGLPVLG